MRVTVLGDLPSDLVSRLDHLHLRDGDPLALVGGHWAIPIKVSMPSPTDLAFDLLIAI